MGLSGRDVTFAVIAVFIAWGFVTNWVPSLRWVPQAFLAGVVVAIVGGVYVVVSSSKGELRGGGDDMGAATLPAFVTKDVWKTEIEKLRLRKQYKRKALHPPSRAISRDLDGILDLILRDYVRSWFDHISGKPLFENEVDAVVRTALLAIRERLLDLDLVETVVSRIFPILTAHIRSFCDAEREVRGKSLSRSLTESDELDLAIAAKYRNGKLHPAASLAFSSTKLAEQQHLRGIAARAIRHVLPPSMTTSRAVSSLMTEIVACAVLYPVVQLLADPDTWNQQIVQYGQGVLQDRKSVRKLRAALDEHAPPTASPSSPRAAPFPRLTPADNEKRFERFIRAIRRCNNLSDARRFRSEVASQLRKESAVENQDQIYLRRLETGKRLLDQKVAQLGAGSSSTEATLTSTQQQKASSATANVTLKTNTTTTSSQATGEGLTLRTLLYDASGLSYFMEYMDRLGLMRLVQFWIVVDGFRNPLEGDDDEASWTASTANAADNGNPTVWVESDRADLSQISDAYLSKTEVAKICPDTSRAAVRAFLDAGPTASAELYRQARSAVLKSQSAVYQAMVEKYFEGFKRSDVYYKWLGSAEASRAKTMAVSPTAMQGALQQQQQQQQPYAPRAGSFESVRSVDSAANDVAPAPRRPRPSARAKMPDLRKNVLSSTDLRSKAFEEPVQARRSFEDPSPRKALFADDIPSRKPLFEDDMEEDSLARSTASFDSDAEMFIPTPTPKPDNSTTINALQAALTDIMGEDEGPGSDSLFPDQLQYSPKIPDESQLQQPVSGRSSIDMGTSGGPGGMYNGAAALAAAREKHKPSLASLGLVGQPTRHGVFREDDLFGEEQAFAEDERDDAVHGDGGGGTSDHGDDEPDIHEAAPGDLGLAEAIDGLTLEIEKLVAQESIVDSLTKKAELTNNAAELRILKKSKASLQREIHRKELQRQQYIVQESDNSLYGRATVRIKSIMVGNEEDGREYALYVIEVQRHAVGNDAMSGPGAVWAIARRYSEFHDLNKRLRARYPQIRHIEFPPRKVVLTLQRDFLEKRRIALEKYLNSLIKIPAVCRTRELRSFLSQHVIAPSASGNNGNRMVIDQRDFVTRIYNSVTDGMEEFLGNIPVLDQLSLAGQNIISAATMQMNSSPAAGDTITNPPSNGAGAGASSIGVGGAGSMADSSAFAAATASEAEISAIDSSHLSPIVKPICDLFLETFELNRGNNWLRGRAVVVVLQQLLGGTVERRVREQFSTYVKEDMIRRYLSTLRDTLWPNGKPRVANPRTIREIKRTRTEAGTVLAALIPDLAGSIVGRANAVAASRKVFAGANNGRLNVHLVYTILDEVVRVLFHEDVVEGGLGLSAASI